MGVAHARARESDMREGASQIRICLAQPHKRLGFVAVYSTRLNLIRHEMQHFVNKLQDYFMAHVLYIQWAKFEALVVEAKELSDVEEDALSEALPALGNPENDFPTVSLQNTSTKLDNLHR